MNKSQLNIFKKFNDLHSQALKIHFLFEDAPSSELLSLATKFGGDTEKFLTDEDIGWQVCGNLGRHLNFLIKYLKSDTKQFCEQDIKDIILFDFPQLFKHLVSLPDEVSEFDPVIQTAIFPLLDGGHYDSAIRKTFVLLTHQLRKKFNIQEQLDGDELINRIFGTKSEIVIKLDDAKKQALRNLLCGFYGVFRNKFAHNATEPRQSEVKAVLEMANAILIEIDSIEL